MGTSSSLIATVSSSLRNSLATSNSWESTSAVAAAAATTSAASSIANALREGGVGECLTNTSIVRRAFFVGVTILSLLSLCS